MKDIKYRRKKKATIQTIQTEKSIYFEFVRPFISSLINDKDIEEVLLYCKNKTSPTNFLEYILENDCFLPYKVNEVIIEEKRISIYIDEDVRNPIGSIACKNEYINSHKHRYWKRQRMLQRKYYRIFVLTVNDFLRIFKFKIDINEIVFWELLYGPLFESFLTNYKYHGSNTVAKINKNHYIEYVEFDDGYNILSIFTRNRKKTKQKWINRKKRKYTRTP